MLTMEVRRFILMSIPSVPYLEALLLLHTEPAVIWTAPSLAQRLYIAEKDAQKLLEKLHSSSIAKTHEHGSGFLYAPLTDDVHALIIQLAALYSKDLLEITYLIHSKTDRGAQQFAEAFKLRRDS